MTPTRPPEGPRSADAPDAAARAEEPPATTRRGVLTASAAGVSGLLLGGRGWVAREVGPASRSAPVTGPSDRLQTTTAEWSRADTLTADDPASGARFGYAVATDGDRALVGAESDRVNDVEAGAAYVFDLEGDDWDQTQRLTADDGAPGDRFGATVALDGERALVGARQGDGRTPDAGAAYVFELDGDAWIQTQTLTADDGRTDDRFARSVALDGPWALVGARRNDEVARDGGAVYVFELDGGDWVQTQKLLAEDADPNDRFGRTVALDGSRALVGTRLDDGTAPDAGAAYVFELEDGRWHQTQKLLAEDADPGDRFGSAVALGGDRALIGAERDDESAEDGGAVYAFAFDEGSWDQTQKLLAPTTPGTRLGSAVALRRSTVLVGAEHDSEKGVDAGAVYVFQRAGNRWRRTQKLLAPGDGAGARFGSAVALGEARAFVGAPGGDDAVDDEGAVYVFAPGGATQRIGPSRGAVEEIVQILAGVVTLVAGIVAVFRYVRNRNPPEWVASAYERVRELPPSELIATAYRNLRDRKPP